MGFVAEGLARGNVFFNGTQRDQVIMSIIRPDWVA
jgi:RimJ/RimL family protein N-acetyltransferase